MNKPNSFQFCFVRPDNNRISALRVIEVASLAPTEAEVLERLEKAFSKWTSHTDEGKQAWADSSDDLNIGDLAAYFDAEGKIEPSLSPFLQDEGIFAIKDVLLRTDILQLPYDRVLAHQE